jgi:hypothetical protein
MAKTMVCEVVGRTLVLVQNELPMDDAEYEAVNEIVRTRDFYGMLIWVPKNGPNSAQRTSGRKALEARGKYTPLAIMTNSPVARAVMGIFALFIGDQIKGFQPTDFEGAFKHIAVEGDDRELIRGAVERLKAQLRTSTHADVR